MGSGKSTLGRKLALSLKLAWYDLDDEFEAKYRIGIPEFFNKYGETAFREIEQKMLLEFSEIPETVISTGGGLPCFFDNMNFMKKSGCTIYLKAEPGLIISRLETTSGKRPLFQQMRGENLKEKITKHLELRKPYYENAHIIVDAENPVIDEIILKIKDYFLNSV